MTRLSLLNFLIVMAGFSVLGQQAASCPTISVVGPDQIVQIGEPAFFRVDVVGVAADAPITYDWKVDHALISDGQGTNLIRIIAPADSAGSNVRATVTVSGLPAACEAVASELVGIAPGLSCGLSADEYGNIPWEEQKARLDNVLVQMNYNRDYKAFFQISVGPEETVDNTKKHILKIAKHFRWRNPDFDLGRLFFGIQKADNGHTTRLYMMNVDADIDPLCGEGCTLLKGKNLSL